ncbi:MAG: flavin reductase family protein [bacterium]|nr:flavin reductase family protein [bacterium]
MSEKNNPVESEILEKSLRQIPAPVAVVGACADGVLGGLTAAWVTRVSLDPAMLLVAVGHERYTYDLLKSSDEFTISLPNIEQVDTARLFGLKSRRDVDKWAQVDHVLLGRGTPALKNCTVRFLCRKTDAFKTGDHDCFVGEVVEADSLDDLPALPMRGADYAPRKK